MKILEVIPFFYPDVGGIQFYTYHLCRKLIENHGYDITVMTSTHGKETVRETIEGMKVVRMPYMARISHTPVHPGWRKRIEAHIRDHSPDIVHGNTPVPYMADVGARAARAAGVPYILTYQNDIVKPGLLNVVCKAYYSLLGNRTLDLADVITATSDHYAKSSPYLGPRHDKVRIVSVGVDLDGFEDARQAADPRARLGLGASRLVLFVGQLDRTHAHKGLDVLIEACSVVAGRGHDLKLLVVGQGDHMGHYRETAARFGLAERTVFCGFVPDEELPGYYRSADMTVLPSINEAEGFGMVLLEANAASRPVIGTRVGGIPYAIEEGETGLLVRPGDPKDLADAIERLLEDEDLARSLGERGRLRVTSRFTWDRAARDFDEVCREVLGR